MQALSLLPQPRALAYTEGVCPLNGTRRIALQGDAPAALHGAGQRLQRALGEVGVQWQLAATALGAAPPLGALLRVAPEQVPQPQGYTLTITPDGITIVAHDAAGVFYAVCTLAQIIAQAGATLPALRVEDWPDFAVRGVMLDISRDKVPTYATLEQLADMLAGWKINQLQLYTEHTFAYAQHPDVWRAASPITGDEVLRLDAYCRARFIELVPNQNTFGHMQRWLRLPRYAPLAETHGEISTPWGHTMAGPFSLAPGDAGSLALVRDLLDELLPHFRSRMVNIGADETVDLGQGRSRAEVAQRGGGRVYLDFLLKIIAEAHARGHTPQFWGDIITQHPELVAELPRDVIALEWGYDAAHPFAEHGAQFAAAGVPFYVCPGTSSWNSIAGRTANALGNTRAAAEHGLRHGAVGYLTTDWGDNGHWQHLPVSYLGFAAGAAYSWACAANGDCDLAAAVSYHAFGDATGTLGRVAYDLGNVYRAMDDTTANGTLLFHALQRPLAALAADATLTPARMQGGLDAISDALRPLSAAQSDRPDAALLADEWRQTARMLRHACHRTLLAHGRDPVLVAALRRVLAEDAAQIIGEQRRLWLARNRPGGLDDSLARMSHLLNEYDTGNW